jgi:hypothetical protein
MPCNPSSAYQEMWQFNETASPGISSKASRMLSQGVVHLALIAPGCSARDCLIRVPGRNSSCRAQRSQANFF